MTQALAKSEVYDGLPYALLCKLYSTRRFIILIQCLPLTKTHVILL